MNTTLILLGLGGVAAMTIGGYLFVQGRPPKVQPFEHFLCPGCHHRLRYQARQVGHQGKCSHCGHLLTFPAVSESIG